MKDPQDDLTALRRQLEYYFSDSNLPRDKFLRAKTEENEQGYVPISVLLSFNRLKSLNATPELIADSIKSSTLLALNEDKSSIRRTTPLPDKSAFLNRAIFAKGWRAGGPEPELDYLTKLFSPSGNVLSIRIRRWNDEKGKHFKGSIFVEMESDEAAQRAATEEYTIETEDNEGKLIETKLAVEPIDEYFERKRSEKANRFAEVRKRRMESKKKGNDDKDEKKEDQENDKKPKSETKIEKKDPHKDRTFTLGLILKFEGFGPDVTREDIRETFEPHGEVAWIDFARGDSEGHIRFTRENAATTACKHFTESKTEFGGKLPTFHVLEGEAEEAYWKHMWQKRDEKIQNSKKRRREHGRGGFRGRGKRFRGRGEVRT